MRGFCLFLLVKVSSVLHDYDAAEFVNVDIFLLNNQLKMHLIGDGKDLLWMGREWG